MKNLKISGMTIGKASGLSYVAAPASPDFAETLQKIENLLNMLRISEIKSGILVDFKNGFIVVRYAATRAERKVMRKTRKGA